MVGTCPQTNINAPALSCKVNPASTDTVPVVSTVLAEVAALFPDVDLHLGFDEINQKCWCVSLADFFDAFYLALSGSIL